MSEHEGDKPASGDNGVSANDKSSSGMGRGLVDSLKGGVGETFKDVESIGFGDLFWFRKMLFPRIASALFFVFCIVVLLGGILGALACVIGMATQGIGAGIAGLFSITVGVLFSLVAARIWVEALLVVFKINEGVQDIREMLRKKFE